MKKKIGKLFCIILSVLLMVSFAACDRGDSGATGVDEKIDKNRTQIYVSAYNGGYGLNWLTLLKADFEADYPQYQIMISREKNDMKTISDLISSKTGTNNIYITSGSDYVKELIDRDCLVDLDEVFNAKASANESKLIKEKMHDADLHKSVFSKRDGSGIYTFPYTRGFTGIIIDSDLFIEKGWFEFASDEKDSAALSSQGISYTKSGNKLIFQSSTGYTNYEQGDYILTAGRDGKYGTYDDGQPVDEEGFGLMLAKIKASQIYSPFIYSSENPDYVNNVISSIFATYEGFDDYKLFYSFNGEYSRDQSLITPETGYLTYDFEGYKKSAQFAYDFMSGKDSAASVVQNKTTYTEAQNNFILGYQIASTDNKAGAMLIDGIWWENEAKATIDTLGKTEPERAYGKRDFRYLIYPEIEGARGIDGNGNGNLFTAYEEGLIFIDKNYTKESLLSACKEFVKYTCRDKYLVEAAKVACVRPYDFDVSSAYSSMTKFVRNVNEMYSDTENIKVISTAQLKCCSDLSFYGLTSSTLRWRSYPVGAFNNNRSLTVDDWQVAEKQYFMNNWNNYLNKMNGALGAL